MLISTETRFWQKVDKKGPDECWGWKSTKNWQGYGLFYLDGRQVTVHRLSFKFHNGFLPESTKGRRIRMINKEEIMTKLAETIREIPTDARSEVVAPLSTSAALVSMLSTLIDIRNILFELELDLKELNPRTRHE